MRYLILFVFSCLVLNGFAQNVGVGTNKPRARLHVAGLVKTDSAFIVKPISKAASASISISNNDGFVTITNVGGTQANIISMSGTPKAGQMLTVNNQDNSNAFFSGIKIPLESIVVFFYDGSDWNPLTGEGIIAQIVDTDGDTKVVTETQNDDDLVRVYNAGSETWRFSEDRFENKNGSNLLIGNEAGLDIV